MFFVVVSCLITVYVFVGLLVAALCRGAAMGDRGIVLYDDPEMVLQLPELPPGRAVGRVRAVPRGSERFGAHSLQPADRATGWRLTVKSRMSSVIARPWHAGSCSDVTSATTSLATKEPISPQAGANVAAGEESAVWSSNRR